MKRSYALLTAGLFLSGLTVVHATGVGAAGPYSGVYQNTAAQGLSLQFVAEGQRYDLTRTGTSGPSTQFDSLFFAGRIGYDIADWCTVYGSLGAATADLTGTGVQNDTGLHWDLGTSVYLWEQDIVRPSVIESILGIVLNTQFGGNYANGDGGMDTTWYEWLSSVLLTLEVPNKGLPTVQDRMPFSATYYVGPLFSYMDLDVDGTSLSYKTKEEFGFLAGAAINISQELSLIGEYRYVDENSGFAGSVAYKF